MGNTLSATDIVSRDAPKHTEFAGRGAAVVTGSTSGIGINTTEALLGAGFDRVFATFRSKAAADELRAAIVAKHGEETAKRLAFCKLDLTDVDSCVEAAAQIDNESGEKGVSVLINNAGIMMCPFGRTVQGAELQSGTNHIGHTAFTMKLLPALQRSGQLTGSDDPARIVNVASTAHAWVPTGFDFTDIEQFFGNDAETNYNSRHAYGISKSLNMLSALALNAQFKKNQEPIYAVSLHPGVIATNLSRHMNPVVRAMMSVVGSIGMMKSPDQGAATSVHCALSKTVLQGATSNYFSDCLPATATAHAADVNVAVKMLDNTNSKIAEIVGNK